MNVYILSVAKRLAEQGIIVDIFTRCAGRGVPEVEDIGPGSRLIQIPAGPCAPVAKEDLPGLLPAFLGGVLDRVAGEKPERRHSPYDVVHSHYWLSGWVGDKAKSIWGAPHVASFHTLGEVKNHALAAGDLPEPPRRLEGERRVIRTADRILAPTTGEAEDLVGLYGASRERISVVSPGVDQSLFAPQPKSEAKARLGLPAHRLLLFVGRLQPSKGPDVAIRAFAMATRRDPNVMADVVLAVVGGPTGSRDEVAALEDLARRAGVGDRVRFFSPQPHNMLAHFYSAADIVLVPSRSESFGLVALEAQACGAPVIATATGGLRHTVADGVSGMLVDGFDPSDHAARILSILEDPTLHSRMSAAARKRAARFSWDSTADGIRAIYRELSGSPPGSLSR